MTTPAGWYDDPQNAGQQRYWDGQQWTDPMSDMTGFESAISPEKKGKPAWFWPVMAVIGFVGGSFALVLIAAIVMVATGNVPEEPAAAAEPTVTVTEQAEPAPTVTETEQATEPEETEAPESPAADDSQGGTGEDSGSGGHAKTMPNLIGDNLQNAQDQLQSMGSYALDQRDASGAGRIQILDSGWVVCEQKPKPGGRLTSGTLVVLDSVKIGESCP